MRFSYFIIIALVFSCNKQSSFKGDQQQVALEQNSFLYAINIDSYKGTSLVDSFTLPALGTDLSQEVLEISFPAQHQIFNEYGGRQIYLNKYLAIDSFSQMNVSPGVYFYLSFKNTKNLFIFPEDVIKHWSDLSKKMDLSKLAFSGMMTINDHSNVSKISNLGNVTPGYVSTQQLKQLLTGLESNFDLTDATQSANEVPAQRTTSQKAILEGISMMSLTDSSLEVIPKTYNGDIADFVIASQHRSKGLAYIQQGTAITGRWSMMVPLMVANQKPGVKYILKQPLHKTVKVGGKNYSSEDILTNEMVMLERFRDKPGFAKLVEKAKIDGKLTYIISYQGDDLDTFYKKSSTSPLLDPKKAKAEDKSFQKFAIRSIAQMRNLGAIYWDATPANIVATTVDGQTQFTIINLEELRDLADLEKSVLTAKYWGSSFYKAPETSLAGGSEAGEIDAWAAAQYPWAVSRARLFYNLELNEDTSSYSQMLKSAPEALQMMLLPEADERLKYYFFCECWLKASTNGDRVVFQKYDLEKGENGGWVDSSYKESSIKSASDLSQYDVFPKEP